MADYTSFGSAPLPTRPYGPMTGIAQADADFMQRQAQLRSLEDMFTANDMRKAELERYQGVTPGTIATSEYEGALARGKQGILPSTLQGLVGEAQSKQAAGQEAMGTVGGKVDAANAENRSKAAHAQLQFLDSRLPLLEQAAARSPMEAQTVWDQMLQESKAPFPRQFDQTTLPNLKRIREHLVNSVTQQQKQAELATTIQGHKDVAGIQGDTSRAVARIGQEGQNWRSQMSAEEKSRMKKLEEKLVEFATISTTRPLTPQETATRNEIFQVMQMLAIARGAAGPMTAMQFVNPGATPPQPQGYPGAQSPNTAPRQFRTEQEAINSGVKGEVIINGRRARID